MGQIIYVLPRKWNTICRQGGSLYIIKRLMKLYPPDGPTAGNGTWLDLRPLLERLGTYANIYSFVVYVIDPLFPHLRT